MANSMPPVHAAPALPTAAATIPLGTLFLAAVQPVLKVAVLCSVGAVCASKGLLTPDSRRVISQLVFHVFTPCLFISKLGSGMGIADALRLWPVTVNMVATHVVGLLLGLLLVRLAKPPRELHKHLVLTTAVGNTGNLPMVLVSSLGADPSLPFLYGAAELGLQYVILGSFSAAFIQFPLAFSLLRKGPEQEQQLLEGEAREGHQAQSALDASASASNPHHPHQHQQQTNASPVTGTQIIELAPAPSAAALSGTAEAPAAASSAAMPSAASSPGGSDQGGPLLGAAGACSHHRHRAWQQQQQQQSQATWVDQHQQQHPDEQQCDDQQADELDHDAAPLLATHRAQQGCSSSSGGSGSSGCAGGARSGTVGRQRLQALLQRCKPVLSGILNTPTVACFAALVIASVPPLKAALFTRSGPLCLLGDAASMLGDVAIPALMMVLGANLARGPGVAKVPAACIAATVAARLLLMPLVGSLLVVGPWKAGWFGPDLHPMAPIVMLITHSTPTAIMVHGIATMFGNREDDVSALLFYEYLASLVTLPLAIAAYLAVVGGARL